MPTYREQYDKVISAYFKDEIQPFDSSFCFCGTLAPNAQWTKQKKIDRLFFRYAYSISEFGKMEYFFLKPFEKFGTKNTGIGEVTGHLKYGEQYSKEYEDALFEGMCNALEVLKDIHLSRGEVINEVPVFTKRTKQLINQ